MRYDTQRGRRGRPPRDRVRPLSAGVTALAVAATVSATDIRRGDAAPPIILPVGLHYDEKTLFGSNALVAFHPPLVLDPELARVFVISTASSGMVEKTRSKRLSPSSP